MGLHKPGVAFGRLALARGGTCASRRVLGEVLESRITLQRKTEVREICRDLSPFSEKDTLLQDTMWGTAIHEHELESLNRWVGGHTTIPVFGSL